MIKLKRFTTEEDEIIKQNYPLKGLKFCSNMLYRNYGSVGKRVKVLGLKNFRKIQNNLQFRFRDKIIKIKRLESKDQAIELRNLIEKFLF
jgi:hypothetical protein